MKNPDNENFSIADVKYRFIIRTLDYLPSLGKQNMYPSEDRYFSYQKPFVNPGPENSMIRRDEHISYEWFHHIADEDPIYIREVNP